MWPNAFTELPLWFYFWLFLEFFWTPVYRWRSSFFAVCSYFEQSGKIHGTTHDSRKSQPSLQWRTSSLPWGTPSQRGFPVLKPVKHWGRWLVLEETLLLHHCDFVDIFISPINHHFCRLRSASLCSCSPSGGCFMLLTILVVLLWTSESGSSATVFGTDRTGGCRTNFAVSTANVIWFSWWHGENRCLQLTKHASDLWAVLVRRNGNSGTFSNSGVSDLLPVFAGNFLLAFLSL